MRISIADEINTTLYLNKVYIDNIDFSNKLEMEASFKKLFRRLKKFYNIDINGFYNIKIYIDEYYGTVLEMQKEIVDYYDCFDNHIDMRFVIKEHSFLYEIEDLFNIDEQLQDNIVLYSYHDRLYIRLIKKIDGLILGKIIENSKIIYDDYVEDIIDYGKIIKL